MKTISNPTFTTLLHELKLRHKDTFLQIYEFYAVSGFLEISFVVDISLPEYEISILDFGYYNAIGWNVMEATKEQVLILETHATELMRVVLLEEYKIEQSLEVENIELIKNHKEFINRLLNRR